MDRSLPARTDNTNTEITQIQKQSWILKNRFIAVDVSCEATEWKDCPETTYPAPNCEIVNKTTKEWIQNSVNKVFPNTEVFEITAS